MTENRSHCPNCGSTDIQLQRSEQTKVNWGRAVAGTALFGVVGGAVGAVTGQDREDIANCCSNCGTIWRRKDLYKVRQSIKKLTGTNLDLSLESHRDYVNWFVEDIINPYSDSMRILEEKRKSIHDIVESDIESEAKKYSVISFFFSLGIIIAFMAKWGWLGFGLALPCCCICVIVGLQIGKFMDAKKSPIIQENYKIKLKQINIQIEDLKYEMEQKALDFFQSSRELSTRIRRRRFNMFKNQD